MRPKWLIIVTALMWQQSFSVIKTERLSWDVKNVFCSVCILFHLPVVEQIFVFHRFLTMMFLAFSAEFMRLVPQRILCNTRS